MWRSDALQTGTHGRGAPAIGATASLSNAIANSTLRLNYSQLLFVLVQSIFHLPSVTAKMSSAANKDENAHPAVKGPSALRSILAGSTAGAVEIGESSCQQHQAGNRCRMR